MDPQTPRRTLARLLSTPILLGLLVIPGLALVGAHPAEAIPSFARREGQPCGFCHSPFPKLNSTGMEYKSNGFRFPGEKVQNAWDMRGGPPLAAIAKIRAYFERTSSSGQNSQSDGPDIEVHEAEIMAAGNFTSRVSGFAELEFESDGEPEIGKTWAQVNDLVGEKGTGKLNARLGRTVVDLPFLSQDRRIIRSNYLASEFLDFLNDEVGGELNGYAMQDMSEDASLVHRYGGGVSRTDRDSSNKIRRGFAYYALEMPDDVHLGGILQGGQDTDDTDGDFREIGLLLSGEDSFDTSCGNVTLDMLYAFQAEHYANLPSNQDTQRFHNLALELLYTPVPAWTLGTRVDWLAETEQPRANDNGWRVSQLVRWNVIQNAWVGVEYQHDDGGKDSPVTGSAKRSDTGELLFTLAF
jgi:hypothetical protein